ncbi:Sel1-repeat containing protein [Gracilaria domingensis]|nr:Sel1-repeat containing protein [Gracilaria domingensis]
MQRRDYFAGELLSSAALHVCTEYEAGEQPLSLFDASFMPFKRGSSLFLWEDWDWLSHVRDGRLNKNDLFLNAVRNGIGLPFSCPHFGTLDKNPNSKTVADNGYAPHAFYLERIVEGLPVEFGEEVSQLDTFKLEWFAILLSLGARAECHRQQFPRMRIPETFDEVFKTTDPALENLRDQLGFTNEDDSLGPRDSIHISRLCSFPVSDHCLTLRSDTNRLVMKVGELIDVWMSLTAGEQYEFLLSIDDGWETLCLSDSQSTAGFRGNTSKSMANSSHYAALNMVPNESLFTVQKEVENARLMIQFAKTGHKYDHLDQTITFMGYSMECVRSNLARWLHRHPEARPDVWVPRIEYAERNPLMSNRVVDISDIMKGFMTEVTTGKEKAYFLRKGVQNLLIWKMQTEFQRILLEPQMETNTSGSGPSSEILMMLCILSFPALQVDISEEIKKPPTSPSSPFRGRNQKNFIASSVRINVRPSCAPQRLFVGFHCETREDHFSAFAVLGREDRRSDQHFLWESWRDSFTARLLAMSDWQKEHSLPYTDVMKSPPNISRKTEFMTTGAIGTGEKIRTWLGWLPFRFEFCRYEVEHPEFLKQYPRRTSFEVAFPNRLQHQLSTARLPGFTMHSFRYEQCDPEYLMYACSVVRDYLGSPGQRPIETLEHLGEEVMRMLDKPSEYFAAGTRKLHRAVILLEIAAIELGNPVALSACIKHLTAHHHIAADITRAVELLERCVSKFYIMSQETDSTSNEKTFDIGKSHIEKTYSLLMSTHGYEAHVFWSYFKFLELMSSGDLSSSSLQSTMRRTFMHTRDYDIVFELGQFPTSSMIVAPSLTPRSLGRGNQQALHDIEFAFYERAIEEGRSARSMFELGRMYEKGERGLHVDDTRAAALYHMAIVHGHAFGAKKALGDLYLRGAPRLLKREGDLEYAVKMYWRAVAEDYDGEAMYELGHLYQFDDRLANDPVRAAALYQGAIIQSNEVRAMRRLASMYRNGDGVSKDAVLSVTLYQLAIDIGDDNDSRAQLARLLSNGDEGVEPDEERANNLNQHLQREGMMVPRT